ncbi:MAG TPA: YeeE/YedE thiosulfate transporter family protein [Anaerolineales bacterium]|jgi:hypothetical protein
MTKIRRLLAQETWSPYLAGGLLGVVGLLAVGMSNSLLGASGAFENLAGILGKAIAPEAFDNLYFNYVMPAEITWSVVLLIGMFFGGMLGAATAGTLRWRTKPDEQWQSIFGPSTAKRWGLAFGGGIVLQYAAGIAGGCTSGLAISGGMLLAPAAFLFIAGMFASGIATALIVYRRSY